MRVLITGGGGFIGRELVILFARSGADVLTTVHLHMPTFPSDISDRITLIHANLAQGFNISGQIDLIVHAAAVTHLDSQLTGKDYIQNNIQATMHLADAAQRANASLMVYLSTISIYGKIESPVLREDTPLNHPGLYGISKYMAELVLRESANNIPAVSLRLPGVVGKNYFLPWFGRMLLNILHGKNIEIYHHDFLFNNIVATTDIYECIIHLIDTFRRGFEAVNLASETPVTVQKAVELLITETESPSKIIKKRSNTTPFWIDIQKTKSCLNFYPRTTGEVISEYCKINKHCAISAQASS